jgi:hypothetical protein
MVDSFSPVTGGKHIQSGTLMPFRGGGVHPIAMRILRMMAVSAEDLFLAERIPEQLRSSDQSLKQSIAPGSQPASDPIQLDSLLVQRALVREELGHWHRRLELNGW